MSLEAFPEIENFQKLPRQVIVKGGTSTYTEAKGAELRGIVINNIGHPIKELSVHLVILDAAGIPVMSTGVNPDPNMLEQGAISSFVFQIKNYSKTITNYYLYANWKFDERG